MQAYMIVRKDQETNAYEATYIAFCSKDNAEQFKKKYGPEAYVVSFPVFGSMAELEAWTHYLAGNN
jgi:hypothetical protein